MLDLRSVRQLAAMLCGACVGTAYRSYRRLTKPNVQAGFAFASALRDAGFRDRVRALGGGIGDDGPPVIAVEAVMPAAQLAERIRRSRLGRDRQIILAIEDPHSPHGLWLAGVVRENYRA